MQKIDLRKQLKSFYQPSVKGVTEVQACVPHEPMVQQVQPPQLAALLRHPSLWRGRGSVAQAAQPTGFAALDAALPGGGWPRRGLVEILTSTPGQGELTLWVPLLRQLSHLPNARCCAFIAPPFELFTPAWRAAGIETRPLLVVRTADPLWALEQALLSGTCALGFAWTGARVNLVSLRRLVLAAERGASLGVLIRPPRAGLMHTAASLRMSVARSASGLSVQLLKGRGLFPRSLELGLP